MAKQGYKVEIYERRKDFRKENNQRGRSINLTLTNRAFETLSAVPGLVENIHSKGCKLFSRCIHAKDGSLSFQAYGKPHQYILSIERGFLNNILLEEALKFENIKVHFDHKCLSVDLDKPKLAFLKDDKEKVTKECNILFGCDGVHSAVRHQMQKRKRDFSFSQDYIELSYKELSIPATKEGEFALRSDCLHVWPRGTFLIVAMPNRSKDFTTTLFLKTKSSSEEEYSFQSLNTDEKVLNFFKKEFPDVVNLIPNLLEQWNANKDHGLMYLKCSTFNDGGKTLLLGDSANSIIPFYGQGSNCGLESCRILNELMIKEKGKPLNEIFDKFSILRKPSADAILDLSIFNLVEMMDKTGKLSFLAFKKFELILSKIFSFYKPLYEMVAFTPEMPYETVLKIHSKRVNYLTTFSKILKSSLVFGGVSLLFFNKDTVAALAKKLLSFTTKTK